MPPKKATGAATQKKTPAAATHASYKDMIKEAILTLKERNGSSRQALKKYILANNKTTAATPAVFDTQFNKALRTGVEKGDFTQPKGASGPVKLAKKESAAKVASDKPKEVAAPKEKKPVAAKAAKKTAAPKEKKAASKAKPATAKKEKAPAAKKEKAATAKPKANTATKRKAAKPAPAIVPEEKVLGKTKSGRVTKSTAKPTPAKKAPAAKKATPKKTATPKKV